MARTRKPRKAYRPKCERGQLPVTLRFSADAGLYLHIAPREALESVLNGRGKPDDWHTLAARLNWGAVASQRFDGDGQRVMAAALEAVLGLKDRGERTGKWGVTGDEYRALALGLDCCEQMDQHLTRREMRDDLRTVFSENERARRAA